MAAPLQLTFVNFAKDSYIIVEGKRNADRFFIIRTGKVKLSKEVQIVAEEGDILNPGDFFGVVSTMSGHSHIETAQALTDVTLISVLKDQFSQLIQSNAPVAMKIIMQFSKRMRFLDEALTRLTLKNNAAEEAPSHLFNVAEFYAKHNQFSQALLAYLKYVKFCPKGTNVQIAHERMKKIAPFVKNPPREFKSDEMTRTYSKDDIIFCEGEPGDQLFIIQKGSVKIIKITENNEILLAVLKAGDIFGEMALLESKPRAAGAVAFEECQLMAVNRANFQQMIQTQPQLIARLTTLLSERIWLLYKQLANTQINDPLGRMFDLMQTHIEKKKVDLSEITSFSFDFGVKELITMVGLSPQDGTLYSRKLMETPGLQIINNKLYIKDINEIIRQNAYFKKMQQLEKSRMAKKTIL